MESPSNHGGGSEEEYSSCESGWTMYIEDVFHGNEHSVVVDDDENDDDSEVKDIADDGYDKADGDDDSSHNGGDEESDDSMASDASSGPSNQFQQNSEKHAARKSGCSKQVHLQKRQHRENRASKTLRNEREESELKARTRTSAASHVQSRGKVSKSQ